MCSRLDRARRQGRGAGVAALLLAAAVVAALALLAELSPPQARANVPCDVGTGPVGAVTGAVGLGNPVGDACNTVTNAATGAITAPVTGAVSGALEGISSSVFGQLTSWVSEGASWLMGQVVEAIDSSTTPRLDTKGFLAAYGRMAAIAAVMACAMLLLAILEGIAQGSPGLLARVVLINVPLAFLGTSLAFAVVQLLIGVTDGLSAAIADASHHDSTRFFEAAIGDLGHVGGEVGKKAGEAGGEKATAGAAGQAAGSVAVPLFVGFLAAIVGAFAAFFVWLELLMRDAAVYAVSLFMPLALAAAIWPRWTGALRRTGELLVAVIGSKFVIVAIVSLAASLVAEEGGSVEHVLAAAALMSLACFAPFVLLRLIPFSEGALAAAYGRRSSAGGAISAVQIGSDVQILRNMGGSGGGSGVSLWGAGDGGAVASAGGGGGTPTPGGGGGGAGRPGGGAQGGAAGGGPGGAGGARGAGGSSTEAGAEASGTAAVAAVPISAAKGAKGAAGRLSETAAAQGAGASPGPGPSQDSGSSGSSGAQRGQGGGAPSGEGGGSGPPAPGAANPAPQRPSPEGSEQPAATNTGEIGGSAPPPGERPPRPSPAPSGSPSAAEKPGGEG
ncbi:MAG: hypothetical protein AB7V58_04925 [Solirubrobacterales bacterium]